jgi:aspartate carbamoyltransferase
MNNARHLLRASDLSLGDVYALLDAAACFERQFTEPQPNAEHRLMRHQRCDRMQGRVLINFFAEPSTRTRLSFERAMLALGGCVQNIGAAESSLEKGESFEDMGRVLSCYGDVIAVRHPSSDAMVAFVRGAQVPVVNAGDGSHEHPTQSLLDLYTMRRRLGRLEQLVVGFLGDLKHSRTMHSLAHMLVPFNAHLVCVSPPALKLPGTIGDALIARGARIDVAKNLASVLPELDVLYVTRLQRERFEEAALYDSVCADYQVSAADLVRAKRNMVIMHPLPRVRELDPDVDSDPRAAYFDQVRYGVPVRMAILAHLLA